MRIEVPQSLDQITIGQFLKWKNAVDKSSEEFLPFQLISIFCNIDLNDVIKIPIKQFEEITATLGIALSQEPKFKNTFKIDGIEYGFIPNLESISTAEYIDLDSYVETDVLKAMMVMYRPIKNKFGQLYNIKEYNGTDGFEIMKNAPASIFLGAKVFFSNLSNELLMSLPNFLQRTITEEERTILVKNGDGISQLMPLLQGMSLNMSLFTK